MRVGDFNCINAIDQLMTAEHLDYEVHVYVILCTVLQLCRRILQYVDRPIVKYLGI